MPHRAVPDVHRASAKAMRRQMTTAEFRLWTVLRDESLHGLKFRRQVPLGGYIVDFLCPSRRLIVEVDGDQHGFDANIIADRRRTEWLERQGFGVLRFGNREVMHNLDGVWRTIAAACGIRSE